MLYIHNLGIAHACNCVPVCGGVVGPRVVGDAIFGGGVVDAEVVSSGIGKPKVKMHPSCSTIYIDGNAIHCITELSDHWKQTLSNVYTSNCL